MWRLNLGHSESLALAERAIAVTRPGLRSDHAVQVPSQASGICTGLASGEPRLSLRLGQAQPGPGTDAAQGAQGHRLTLRVFAARPKAAFFETGSPTGARAPLGLSSGAKCSDGTGFMFAWTMIRSPS